MIIDKMIIGTQPRSICQPQSDQLIKAATCAPEQDRQRRQSLSLGTHPAQPQARGRQNSKVAKLILRSRLILRDTHRLDVCGTRLGSTDQALIELVGRGRDEDQEEDQDHTRVSTEQIVGLVLILDPHLRQST
jgi:hypothetical protein